MKLKDLEAFLRVAEAGSVRAGARLLNRSQPAVTASLQQLERELGAQILLRTKRGVQPTHYGEALLRRAHSICAEADRAREEIAQLRGNWTGTIRFAVSPAIGVEVMPDVIRSFMRRYPLIRLHLQEGLYPEIGPALRSGQLDFAVGPGMIENASSSGRSETTTASLIVEPVIPAEVVIATVRGAASSRSDTLRNLVDHDWILSGSPPGPGAVILDWFSALDLPPPRIRMVCESFLIVPSIVAATGMLATMPRAVFDNVASRYSLVAVPVKDVLAQGMISIMRRAESPPTPAAAALIEAIRRAAARRLKQDPRKR